MQDNVENKSRRKANELFDQVKTDDQKAFELLFSIYFARLNDFAKHVVKDNIISQDIVLEVFLKVWENRSKIESLNLEAFLFHLVRNRCIDYIKHLKVENHRMYEIEISTKYEELYRIDFIGNEPYVLIEQELNNKIEKTIQGLPGRCREVFILSRMDGLKNKEIAEKLGINIKNVERHLNRAMQSFLKVFSEDLPIALIVLLLKSL
ncbi:MAG: RNA polymerase sigma-70 factor [Bacteroidetes bacterium]|nr:RNA polymerase sigma-70 factor [Bacteroidota bacterium]MCL6101572.1 RNA polymerase sigma-70 factor [Bacteroidota bacterium]